MELNASRTKVILHKFIKDLIKDENPLDHQDLIEFIKSLNAYLTSKISLEERSERTKNMCQFVSTFETKFREIRDNPLYVGKSTIQRAQINILFDSLLDYNHPKVYEFFNVYFNLRTKFK